jgi:uncharacterized membrane protein YccC
VKAPPRWWGLHYPRENIVGILIAIALALVVFWIVAHVSVLLAVVAALLVLAFGAAGGRAWGARTRL